MDTPLPWLRHADDPFPPTRRALGPHSSAPGLLAAGGALTTRRLEMAYRAGVFPWYSTGQPVLWWTPDPRMVLPVSEFRISRSLRRSLRRFMAEPGCEVRIDHAFDRVIEACAAAPRDGQDGTWIVPELAACYRQWHREGRVHSVETWMGDELVGGLYGVSIGRMFFGESMFARRTDASKIALAALVAFCRQHGIALIDCQQNTSHLASLGAREITRERFEAHLARTLPEPEPAHWTYDSMMWTQLDLGTSADDVADEAARA